MSKLQKKIVKKEIENYSALEAVKASEGGQLLITSLKKDIISSLAEISAKYKSINHPGLIAICAQLSANLTLFRVLSRASKNKKLAIGELDELLKETDEVDE